MQHVEIGSACRRLAADVLAALFPETCPLCRGRLRAAGSSFCTQCLCSFRPPPTPQHADLPLQVRSAAAYEGSMRRAILRVKYRRDAAMAVALGRYLRDVFTPACLAHPVDTVLPVPIHTTRLRRRRFNQCVPLSRPLAAALHVPLELDAVRRTRNMPSQTASDVRERRRNLRDAFQLRDLSRIRGRRILIVDDVLTTGATLESLTATLRAGGARRVEALTLAHADRRLP